MWPKIHRTLGEEEKTQNINRSWSPNRWAACPWLRFSRSLWMLSLTAPEMSSCRLGWGNGRGGGDEAEWRWGAGNVENPVERSAIKDRGSTVGVGVGVGGWISHRHRSDSDLFSSRFILTSFASPSLPHTVTRVIVQSLGSAGKRNLNRWAPTSISPLWQPQPSVIHGVDQRRGRRTYEVLRS